MKVKHLFSYLFAGDGKTHYITEQLKSISQPHKVIIAVNEAFTYMNAIEKLCSLPSDKNGCAIFFNFTVLPPPVSLLLCSMKMCINLLNTLMARFIYQFTQYTSLKKWCHHSNIFRYVHFHCSFTTSRKLLWGSRSRWIFPSAGRLFLKTCTFQLQ